MKYSSYADLVLVLITVIWGTTFSITKLGLNAVPPLMFLAIRFAIAFILLVALCLARRVRLSRQTALLGILVGLLYAGGFAAQTIGIHTTTASKAAFITGLSVILVPIFQGFILRRNPGRLAITGSVFAFAGLALLSVDGSLTYLLSIGDVFVLACTVFFALHIIFVGKWSGDVDPVLFTTVQVGVTGVVSWLLSMVLEVPPAHITGVVWAGLGYLAVFATLGTTLLQVWAQRYTSPTRTAIIFTLEPVFAAAFALMILHEIPSVRTLIGGTLIVGGIILSELPSRGGTAGETLPLSNA